MNKKKKLTTLLAISGVAIIAVAVGIIITTFFKPTDDKQNIHSLSGNEAISIGLTNMFMDVANPETISNSKTISDILIRINILDSSTEWSDMPDFDHEAFTVGLTKAVEDSIKATSENITATSTGKQALADGEYHCYKANIPVKDFANILEDAIIYALNNKELQAYMDEIYKNVNDTSSSDDSDDLYYDYDIDMSSQMSSIALMLESYWPRIVAEFENTFGENIQFTVYLTDDVNIVGYSISIPNLFTLDIDMSKDLTTDTERPSATPVINFVEMTDEELANLEETITKYISFFSGCDALPY